MEYYEVIEKAKAGEEEAFRKLFDETYAEKRYLASRYVENQELTKKVLEESYVQAFRTLRELTNPEEFPKWLGKIVARTAQEILTER